MAEIVNGVGINKADAHVSKHHSLFPLKEVFMDTHRFGEYHPHFVLDAWESEKHPVRCVADTRSYTLRAPLMQDISMNKDYFMVNLRSILPFQAERVRTNPNLGDDIPADAYTSVSNFIDKVASFAGSFDAAIAAAFTQTDKSEFNTLVLKKFIFLESIFSRGSLLASLGCNLSSCIRIVRGANLSDWSIDHVIDDLGTSLSFSLSGPNKILEVLIDGTYYDVSVPSSIDLQTNLNNAKQQISVREFFQRIRDTADWEITNSYGFVFSGVENYSDVYNSNADFPIDLARLWAYHLAVAEYMTNDKVDYIYSADLFRQYIFSLYCVDNPSLTTSFLTFSWNGSSLNYDYLSAHFFNNFCLYNFSSSSALKKISSLQYFLTLFGYRRSLRFKDYFTGSRTRPLAVVGNSASAVSTDVAVNNNVVSVLDVTRSIQAQRFLNAVNASGRKFGEWINSFFGVTPNKDMHEPIFLAHSSDKIFAADLENTGNAVFQDIGGLNTKQNSVTAVFRGRSNDFEYSVDVKEPCIIIGITSYDIERVYPDTIHRDFFIRDRYDMFNPMLQYIGDQQVYQHELISGLNNPFGTAFGYQFRDMQWKQSFPRCAGAFASDKLPGYAFVFNRGGRSLVVSPDFIRSKNCELDDFYLSLSSYSLGTYFHFIMRQVNLDNASRPMIAQPQIL